MTTAETTKAIRKELKARFPEYKFSVRIFNFAAVNIEYNGDSEIRPDLDLIANKYKGWSEFSTEFVFVNAFGKAVA